MGGTAGAILTCPLEVVKTRLQSSNSGFAPPTSSSKTASTKVPSNNSNTSGTTTSYSKVNLGTNPLKTIYSDQRTNFAQELGKETRTGGTTVPHTVPTRGEGGARQQQQQCNSSSSSRGQLKTQLRFQGVAASSSTSKSVSNTGINHGSVLVRCSSSAVPAAVKPTPLPPGQQMGVLECLR